MVATWMLCGNGSVCGNVIMVATWMLCGNGWRDALWEWIEFVGTLSWLPHGCSVGMDRVCGNATRVATWIHMDALWEWIEFVERYHGWDMDALWEWIEFVERYHGWDMDALWEWIQFVDGVCGNVIMVATWMLCGNG